MCSSDLSILGVGIVRDLLDEGISHKAGVSWKIYHHRNTGAATLRAFVPAHPVVGGPGVHYRYYLRPFNERTANKWATLICRNKTIEAVTAWKARAAIALAEGGE